MAMGFRPRSFPVGEMYVKGFGRLMKGRLMKVKKNHSLLFSKKYFTNPSCLPHWQRKTSPRSTALVSRIGLQPFLRTHWYPALVPCSATAVEADFDVRPKVRQNTRQVLKRTESLIVPKTSHTQALGSADAAEKIDNWSQSLKIQRQAPKVLSRINEKNSLTISEGAPLAARCWLWSVPPWFCNALQINSYVSAKQCNSANANKIRLVDERSTPPNTLSLAAAKSELSVDHITGSGDVWVRACNVWLPQCTRWAHVPRAVIHVLISRC